MVKDQDEKAQSPIGRSAALIFYRSHKHVQEISQYVLQDTVSKYEEIF